MGGGQVAWRSQQCTYTYLHIYMRYRVSKFDRGELGIWDIEFDSWPLLLSDNILQEKNVRKHTTPHSNIELAMGFQEQKFCHLKRNFFMQPIHVMIKLDQSDCFIFSAHKVGPIRLSVFIRFRTSWVTQACLLCDWYLCVWFGGSDVSSAQFKLNKLLLVRFLVQTDGYIRKVAWIWAFFAWFWPFMLRFSSVWWLRIRT